MKFYIIDSLDFGERYVTKEFFVFVFVLRFQARAAQVPGRQSHRIPAQSVLFYFRDRVSLKWPKLAGAHPVDQVGLERVILLPQPPN